MTAAERPSTTLLPLLEPGFALSDASQCLATGAGTEMLLRRARRGEEHDIAAWPVAGQAPGVARNFCWALALAG